MKNDSRTTLLDVKEGDIIRVRLDPENRPLAKVEEITREGTLKIRYRTAELKWSAPLEIFIEDVVRIVTRKGPNGYV
jgi:hypothetical protein